MTQLKRSEGNTIELEIVIPWTEVKGTFDRIFESLIKEVEIDGFRKGKAPRELAEKRIDRNKVYEETLKELLPKFYGNAIKEHDLKPIINPKIELTDPHEGKDWKVIVTTCELPKITLKKYKDAIRKLHQNVESVWTPDKAKDQKDAKKPEVTVGQILEAIEQNIEVELSPLLIEQEVNRMLSNLVTDIRKLGMNIDQYVQAQQKSFDQLKQEYTTEAKKSLSVEFALEEISTAEKIVVEDKEIDTFISQAKNPEEKKVLESRRYYIATVLRRQKTIAELLKAPTVVTT